MECYECGSKEKLLRFWDNTWMVLDYICEECFDSYVIGDAIHESDEHTKLKKIAKKFLNTMVFKCSLIER